MLWEAALFSANALGALAFSRNEGYSMKSAIHGPREGTIKT